MSAQPHLRSPALGTFPELTEQQGAASPMWVKLEMQELARRGEDTAALVFFAQYELYALAVNAYSALANGTTLPAVSHTALFHSLPRASFEAPDYEALPILPLSQEYSHQAAQQAIRALICLVEMRITLVVDKKERTRMNTFVGMAEHDLTKWETVWGHCSREKMRQLSKSVWNAFVFVLQGGEVPTGDAVFYKADFTSAAIGRARNFLPPKGTEELAQVASDPGESERAFHRTLSLITECLADHHRHAPTWKWPPKRSLADDFGVECSNHLASLGNMVGLKKGERRRLLVELYMVLGRLSNVSAPNMASPDQIFQCIKGTPTLPPPELINLRSPPAPSSHHQPQHNSAPFIAHSLGRSRSTAPSASIGLRTAARMRMTPEEWAERAMRRAY